MNIEDQYVSKGPVSSMPGDVSAPVAGTICDRHENELALHRVQGETDSMGCEYNMMCALCYEEYKTYMNSEEARSGHCDWCKKPATDLSNRRDIDEGQAGPLYRVCSGCWIRYSDRLNEELKEDHYSYMDSYDDSGECGCCEPNCEDCNPSTITP